MRLRLPFLLVLAAGGVAQAARPADAIDQVLVSPPLAVPFVCAEHAEGELDFPGDALGTDCMVTGGLDPQRQEGFQRLFRGDGARNEDWYGWGATVLAPFDGEVLRVVANPVVNRPGQPGTPPAAILAFRRDDGTVVVYGHVAGVRVAAGDRVVAGQAVAVVGNNGISRSPHLHVGALRDGRPLQLRWDLRAMAARRREHAAQP